MKKMMYVVYLRWTCSVRRERERSHVYGRPSHIVQQRDVWQLTPAQWSVTKHVAKRWCSSGRMHLLLYPPPSPSLQLIYWWRPARTNFYCIAPTCYRSYGPYQGPWTTIDQASRCLMNWQHGVLCQGGLSAILAADCMGFDCPAETTIITLTSSLHQHILELLLWLFFRLGATHSYLFAHPLHLLILLIILLHNFPPIFVDKQRSKLVQYTISYIYDRTKANPCHTYFNHQSYSRLWLSNLA